MAIGSSTRSTEGTKSILEASTARASKQKLMEWSGWG